MLFGLLINRYARWVGQKRFAPVRCTRIQGFMPKLSNFQNDLCNHFNMKNRFCERRMFGWFWVWLYLPQQREYNLCHQSAVSEFYTRLNQTLPYPWAFASVFSVIYVSLQKGLSNASVVEFGILSLWIYRTQWVNRQSFHICTLVLT